LQALEAAHSDGKDRRSPLESAVLAPRFRCLTGLGLVEFAAMRQDVLIASYRMQQSLIKNIYLSSLLPLRASYL
jgi:hypothetical protein